MITETALNEFLGAVNAMLAEHHDSLAKRMNGVPGRFSAMVTAQPGKKYIRIVKHDVFEGAAREGGSAFCFVEAETGTIMKAAGWKTPAKGNRGNIANGAADLTAYGAVYFR